MKKSFKEVAFRHYHSETVLSLGYVPATDSWPHVKTLLESYQNGFLIERRHKSLQTQLILDGTKACHLFQFDENRIFISHKPVVNYHDAPFSMMVYEPFIMILPQRNDLAGKEMYSFNFNPEKAKADSITKTGGFVRHENIIGEVFNREKFNLEVRILHPYSFWSNQRSITGMHKMTPHHFLTDYGDKLILDLLIRSYKIIKRIDEGIDDFAAMFCKIQEDILFIKHAADEEKTNGIIEKLTDWFYDEYIFDAKLTKLRSTYYDRIQIDKILKTYKETGIKLYLSGVN